MESEEDCPYAELVLEEKDQRGRSIPLDSKVRPSEEWWKDGDAPRLWCVSYGAVDIEPLRKKILGEGALVWEDAGQTTNVRIRRAYHDSAGVRKIIFTFCDDLLENVYRLPWWDSWSDVLHPIFESLSIRPDKVVRCLLARLPPDYRIKVHHDTGRWTSKAHRVHVPIFTEPEKVVFKVGPTEDAMHRVPFLPGVGVELNNRAKHMVHNGWDQPRTHLIFDWVEHDFLFTPIRMTSEQAFLQTRRTLRVVTKEEAATSRCSPSAADEPECEVRVRRRIIREHDKGLREALAALGDDEETRLRPRLTHLMKRYTLGEVHVDDAAAALRCLCLPRGKLGGRGGQTGGKKADDEEDEQGEEEKTAADEGTRTVPPLSCVPHPDLLSALMAHVPFLVADRERASALMNAFHMPTWDTIIAAASAGGAGAGAGARLGTAAGAGGAAGDLAPSRPRPFVVHRPPGNPICCFVVGAQKSGTTGMYEYLAQHPQLTKGRNRELHYFDWHWDRAVGAAAALGEPYKSKATSLFHRGLQGCEDEMLRPAWATVMRDGFVQLFPVDRLLEDGKLGTLESTPSYLLGGQHVAARLRTLFPHARVIVMLRDPVARAYSHLQMSFDVDGAKTDKQAAERKVLVASTTMEDLVERDIRELRRCGADDIVSAEFAADSDDSVTGGGLGEGAVDVKMEDAAGESVLSAAVTGVTDAAGDVRGQCWGRAEGDDGVPDEVLSYFQDEYCTKQPLGQGNHSFVGRGLYYAQLKLWLREFPREQVLVLNLGDQQTPETRRSEVNRAFSFLGLPAFDIADTSIKNSRGYAGIPTALREKLLSFYAPHNQQLYKLLGRDLGWPVSGGSS